MNNTMNTNTIYKNLKERFTTFDALKSWLSTEEGGHLSIRDGEGNLALIHYDKEVSVMTAPHVEYFRSVIWNKETNTPVCVSPCRGRKFSNAIDLAITPATGVVVEEFIDGVMINMFWHGGDWRIASRTQLGAHCRFYSADTYFDQLFWTTFKDMGLATDMLDKSVSYSWVLQHPKERIVVTPAHGIPRIYLVETSTVAADGTHTITDLVPVALKSTLPPRYTLPSLEAVKEHVATWGSRLGHKYQGVVIKNNTGGEARRWKLRSSQYDEARYLRGDNANRGYHWLTLWSLKQIGKYLRFYPEEDADANSLIQRFRDNTAELHRRYVEIYRDRRYPLGEAPHKFRKLLWELHQTGAGTYFPKVRDFMNLQDTARKLWLINYETRYGAGHNPVPLATRPVSSAAKGAE